MDDSFPQAEITPVRSVLFKSSRKEEILEYSLLLASQAIKHWMEFNGEEWSLTLEEADVFKAQEILTLYHAENRGFQEVTPTAKELDLLLSPLLFLAVPVVCYFLVGFSPFANWWHSRGSANAQFILEGQWWRCLTATTLHADEIHFLSNLVSGYFILNLLNHRLGMGTIMVISTMGAGMTNYLVAVASGGHHVSIGYSSVVFCALGILAAVEMIHLPKSKDVVEVGGARTQTLGVIRMRKLTPLISAFFIAVMVGLGEKADVKAHFYGFGMGVALGLLTRLEPKALRRPTWQVMLMLATYGLFALAWYVGLKT